MHNEYAEIMAQLEKKEEIVNAYHLREPVLMASAWTHPFVAAMKQATDELYTHRKEVLQAMSDVAQHQIQLLKELDEDGFPKNHVKFNELEFIESELYAYCTRLNYLILNTTELRNNTQKEAMNLFVQSGMPRIAKGE